MAVETRDIKIGAVPREDADLASTATSGPASRSWLASMLGLRSRRWGQTDGAVVPPSLRRYLPSPPAPEVGLPENPEVVRAEDAPVRLTMAGVLAAWRLADRALGELTAGSPEWAAVNATIISLRASYKARFEAYAARSSDGPEGVGDRE